MLLNSINAQTFYTVIDSASRNPIELATIRYVKSNFTVFTDKNGTFESVKDQPNNLVEISTIGYETTMENLIINKTFILLKPKTEYLDEVMIAPKHNNYNKNRSISSLKPNLEYFSFQFGTENCSYIENPYRKNGRLRNMSLYLRKMRDHAKPCTECKMDYLATFSIRFYEYDSIRKIPGQEIYNKVVMAKPKNKNYKMQIRLDTLNIIVPKKGICIGVEIINTEYKNPKRTFAFIGPLLGFAFIDQYLGNAIVKNPTSWVRYRNEEWSFKSFIKRDNNNRKFRALLIDIDLDIE